MDSDVSDNELLAWLQQERHTNSDASDDEQDPSNNASTEKAGAPNSEKTEQRFGGLLHCLMPQDLQSKDNRDCSFSVSIYMFEIVLIVGVWELSKLAVKSAWAALH